MTNRHRASSMIRLYGLNYCADHTNGKIYEYSKDIFTDDALSLIHQNSGGIPRRINTLCDLSLAMGLARKAEGIDANLVLEASKKFGVV